MRFFLNLSRKCKVYWHLGEFTELQCKITLWFSGVRGWWHFKEIINAIHIILYTFYLLNLSRKVNAKISSYFSETWHRLKPGRIYHCPIPPGLSSFPKELASCRSNSCGDRDVEWFFSTCECYQSVCCGEVSFEGEGVMMEFSGDNPEKLHLPTAGLIFDSRQLVYLTEHFCDQENNLNGMYVSSESQHLRTVNLSRILKHSKYLCCIFNFQNFRGSFLEKFTLNFK